MVNSHICIVSNAALSRTPYLHHYTNALSELGLSYDVYYWQRDSSPAPIETNYYPFRLPTPGKRFRFIRRAFGYARYVFHLKQCLTQDKYIGSIFLGIQAAMVAPRKMLQKRFLVDIRDYSGEWLPPYRWEEARVLRRADLVCISSDGFRRWLPPGIAYCLAHNFPSKPDVSHMPPFETNRFVLAHVGLLDHLEAYKPFLTALRECPEFNMRFIGEGLDGSMIRTYCQRNNIGNVEFAGRYEPHEKKSHIIGTNFITSIYGNSSILTSTALPNKLYDAAIYGRPIIVSAGTFLGEVVGQKGLGIVFDPSNRRNLRTDIMGWYSQKQLECFKANCARFLTEIRPEMTAFKNKVKATLADWVGG